MKKQLSVLAAVLAAAVPHAFAQERHKANNTNALDTTGAWAENVVPVSTNVAVWDQTVATVASCSNNPGANHTWLGIKIANPASTIALINGSTIRTITLHGSGIDMNSPSNTQSLRFGPQLVAAKAQTWGIGAGRSLDLLSNSHGNYPAFHANADVAISGAGTVDYRRTINVNSNSTLTVGSGIILVAGSGGNADTIIRLGFTNGLGGNMTVNGTVRLARTGSSDGMLTVGHSDNNTSVSVLTVNGGVVDDRSGDTAKYLAAGVGTASTGIVNVVGAGEIRVLRFQLGRSGYGVLNLSNGLVSTTNFFQLPQGAAGTGVVNLVGGTLLIPAITKGTGPGTLNFDGGTLQPRSSSTTFFPADLVVNVKDGGAVLDTAGFNLTLSVPLLNAGSGGLTKRGAGTLTLAAINAYTGETRVEAGRLLMSPSVHAGGAIAVSNEAILQVALAGAETLRASALTLGEGGSGLTTNELALGLFGALTVPVLHATSLTVNGTCVVDLSGVGLSVGQHPLITYGSASNLTDASFTNGILPTGVSAYLTNNTANSSIDLIVTAVPNLLWRATYDNAWDSIVPNWIDALSSNEVQFFDGAIAIFDDFASNTSVNVTAPVAPALTLLNNAVSNYAFTGAGSLGGGALILAGGGTVGMGLSGNTYAGDTLISNGVFQLLTSNAIPEGAGKGNVLVNGVLELSGINEAINGLSGGGLVTNTMGTNTLTVGNNNASGVFSGRLADEPSLAAELALTKVGLGTLTLSGASTHAGGVLVSAGCLAIGHEDALGYGALTLNGGSTAAVQGVSRSLTNAVRYGSGTGNIVLDTTAGALTLSGSLSIGAGLELRKIGANPLRFNGTVPSRIGGGTGFDILDGQVILDGAEFTNENDGVRLQANNGAVVMVCVTNGGVWTLGSVGATPNLVPGYVANRTGSNIVHISSGAIRFDTLGYLIRLAYNDNTTGEVIQTGGLVTWAASQQSTGGVEIALGTGARGEYRLAGGMLETPRVFWAGGGAGFFRFDGGVLRASTNVYASAFMTGLTATVENGGAVIDTAGYDITFPQSLAAGGAGGLTKNGLGTLTLTGTNTYTGPTLVNTGQLRVAPAAFAGGGAITVNDGATLGVSLAAAGTSLNASGLALSGGSALTLSLGALGNPVAPVIVAPSFAPAGTATVNVEAVGTTLSLGTFTLIDYSGGIGGDGFGALTLGSLPVGVQAVLVNNIANSSVDLSVTGFVAVVWRGQTDTAWDTNTVNWVEPVGDAPAFYADGIIARFEDVASNASVVVASTVTPFRTIIDNATLGYSFSGAGGIGGVGPLIKTGTGTVTMALEGNSYAGDTLISNGVFALGASNVIPNGAGKGSVLVNGILDLAGNNDDINGLLGGGTVTNSGGLAGATNTLTVGRNNTAGAFSGVLGDQPSFSANLALAKVGSGSLTLSGSSAFSGGTTLSAGTLQIGHDAALGIGRLTLAGSGVTLSSDGALARALANDVTITTNVTLGSTVNSGTLTVSGGVDLGGGARTLTIASDVMLSGGSTNGAVDKLGKGTLTLRGWHGWTSSREVNDGELVIDSGATLTNAGTVRANCTAAGGLARITVRTNATLILNGTTVNLRIGYTGGNATSTNIVDVSGTLSLPTAATTDGEVGMAANCALAVLNLRAGGDLAVRRILHSGGAANMSEVNFDGGVLRTMWDTTIFMQGLTNAFVRDGGAIFDTQGFSITVAQPLLNGGAGGLEKRGAGTLTLATNNTYVGRTTIAGGTLALGASGSIAPSAAIDVRGSAVLDVSAVSGFTVAPGQTLMGGGTVLGHVTVDGALSPGASIGMLLFANDLVLGGTGVTTMETAKAGASLSSDRVAGSATLTYGGTLVVTHSGDALAAGDAFPLFDLGSRSNWFSAVSLPALAPGLGWDTNKLRTDGILEVMTSGTPDGGSVRTFGLAGGVPAITFTGTVGATYVLQSATNLVPEPVTWVGISTSVVPPSGLVTTNDPAATNRVKYYRTVVP